MRPLKCINYVEFGKMKLKQLLLGVGAENYKLRKVQSKLNLEIWGFRQVKFFVKVTNIRRKIFVQKIPVFLVTPLGDSISCVL